MEKKLSYKVPSLRLLNLYSEESFLTSANGGIDPWGASGVGDMKCLRKKHLLRVHTLPEGSHRTRINSFPEPERTQILSEIRQYLAP